jgi:hypothetical protein
MKNPRCRIALLFSVAGFLLLLLAAGAVGAQEQPDWRVEFEAVCSTTDAAMSFTVEELTGLVARCDKLAEWIGAEPEESVRRVFLRRLKMCRDLLAYVLEWKNTALPEAIKPGP